MKKPSEARRFRTPKLPAALGLLTALGLAACNLQAGAPAVSTSIPSQAGPQFPLPQDLYTPTPETGPSSTPAYPFTPHRPAGDGILFEDSDHPPMWQDKGTVNSWRANYADIVVYAGWYGADFYPGVQGAVFVVDNGDGSNPKVYLTPVKDGAIKIIDGKAHVLYLRTALNNRLLSFDVDTREFASPPDITPIKTPTGPPTQAAPSPYRAAFPDPAGYAWTPVASGLEAPVDIQNAGDGSGRLFVVEKPGRIRIVQNGELLAAPFLDIRAEVGSRGTEQGLLGLAFHPKYAQTGLFFVNYTDANGDTVIARFHVSADDPQRADPASQADILRVDQPYANHNGGGLAFGPDGYLYIGLGDGGSAGDPSGNGQNLLTLLGKLLRLDVDHGATYAIPPGNPYVSGGGLLEIWAAGLRNPWRFSFDRLTGDLYIGDVGQDSWEEIDFVPAGTPGGLNFGWNYYEATHPFKGQPPAAIAVTWPVAEYPHGGLVPGQPTGCSVTGGAVYRGQALPEWQGVYLFGDFCNGQVYGLIRTGENAWQTGVLFATGAQISTFGADEAGELLLADYGSGTLLRLVRQP